MLVFKPENYIVNVGTFRKVKKHLTRLYCPASTTKIFNCRPVLTNALLISFLLTDSMKMIYYRKSFDLYHKMQYKEKEIELLQDIAGCHVNSDMDFEKDLIQVQSLMQATGFKHVLYVQIYWPSHKQAEQII